MARIVAEYPECVHVTEYNATSARSAASKCAALARKHFGTRVMSVSSGGTVHDGQIDYSYVFVPRTDS